MAWLISEAMMKAYGNSPSLPERGGEYLGDTSSDGELSAQSSGNLIQQAYCAPDKMTGFSRLSRFGMTFKPLMADRGEELLTSYLAAFHAKTSQQPEKEQESKEPNQECGATWPESLARYDLASSTWRTPHSSLNEESTEFSGTWPRWGSMHDGVSYQQQPLVRHTKETGSGSWPTPLAQDAKHSGYAQSGPGKADKLAYAVVRWPTPTAHNAKEGAYPAELTRNTPTLAARAGGTLNPTWVEWLMGWPLGWTDLKRLEMDKFQQWQKQHGIYSTDIETNKKPEPKMTKPFKQIVTIDYETRWSKADYTLSKMTTEEYIRDPRFKVFGACLHEYGSDEPPRWYNGEDLHDALDKYDWTQTAILAHNAQFDVSILEWVYDCHPVFILDTLSMARALRGTEAGNSLAQLAQEFDLPPKGNAVHNTDGLEELTPEIEAELAEYCAHDVMLCEEIFHRLSQGYPAKELRLIDLTLKMYTQPRLILDGTMLTKAIDEERAQREALLTNLGITDADLASNPKFAQLLEAVGVPAPRKISKTTGEETLALAKNDAMFQAIMNGENEAAALLCEARLKVKSTTERTRAQRFLDISKRGPLPVPLSYYGATTGRWTASKGSAINMQNLKRGSFLRKAILAPMGYSLVVGDLSQIEPRVLAWLSDYEDMLDIFRSGADPYAAFGAQMFNIPGMTKESHPDLRQSAKSALLGCGYGLGWASFASQLLVGFLGAPPIRYDKDFAKQLGVNRSYVERFLSRKENEERLFQIPHTCTDEELLIHAVAAKKIIDTYRGTAIHVVGLWVLCTRLLVDSLVEGNEYTHKCLTFRKGEIELPNGMKIRYPNLRKDEDGNWVYGKDATKLYAGKITNNITQALARIVMTDGMLRVSKRYPVVGTVHDELIALAPEEEAQEALDWVIEQMTMEPSYMPGIPLAADGGTSLRYGDAKQ